MGFFDFLGNIGRGIVSGIKSVGSFVNKNIIQPVGNFVRKIDFSKVGDVAGKIADVAGGIASAGIPIVSTIAKGVNLAGRGIQRLSKPAEKAKQAIMGVQDVATDIAQGGNVLSGLGKGASIVGKAVGGETGKKFSKVGQGLQRGGAIADKFGGGRFVRY
tara:strand:+ start:1326 stop:1805 length:480 start_codon:yes stop_codon:yes gene_type:complete